MPYSSFNRAHNFSIENNTTIYAENYNHGGNLSLKSAIERLQEHIAAGAMYNSAERCDAPKCHSETRIAVREEIVSWILHGDGDAQPTKILWVTGPAGTGKTAIMGSIADTCQEDGSLEACFFFSSFSGSANRRSKRCVVFTLAYQLIQHGSLHQVKRQILAAIERNPAIFEQKLEVQLHQLILQPLQDCRGSSDISTWPKVIVIDGLDECEVEQYHDTSQTNVPTRSKEDDQTEILSILYKAASAQDFPFRIIIASRPEHIIHSFFTHVASLATRQQFLDEKYNPEADMSLFLECKFADIRRRYHLPASWPNKEAIQKLVHNASGQFIHVATVLRFVEGTPGLPQDLLQQVLELPTTTTTNPFAPLDGLYAHILNSSPDPPLVAFWLNLMFRESYLKLLSSVSIKPPPAIFVQLFLESSQGQAAYILRNLHSLISVPSRGDYTSPYSLFHKSLVDFLGDPIRSGPLNVSEMEMFEFLSERYLKLWKNKGPARELTPVEGEIFFGNFFLARPALWSPVFKSQHVQGDVTSCDIAWWIHSFEEARKSRKADPLNIGVMFFNVHISVRDIV
ncbi:hypothetical protein EST38_g4042 [Candolleomyces aberdarensis]|uniref:Nephrocystin 3-like N-terminal domain-containing protein n=1 Tax=Candolleomyces aberdarensis TaxID=2316362 RepID=A0A4V1Q4E7_9AGAR|nr:hypothetical protein EST38_g4042 [Candolleomyces aberdarensis]